jgi:peptide subunit release factor 1 (eRF1)
VLLADQRNAFVHLIDQEALWATVALEESERPRKVRAGGSSQHRYEKRADEEVSHFVRRLGDETQRVLVEEEIAMLVLAAEDEMVGTIEHAFEGKLRAQLLGGVHLGIHATEQELVDATRPLIEHAVREREAHAVATLQDRLNMGGAAVNGPDEVLASLQGGEVGTLVINDDFHGRGWADYTLPVYGVGEAPKEHPAGGDVAHIVPIALEEELVRLAIQTDADVITVRTTVPPQGYVGKEDVPKADEPIPRPAPAKALDELGGVGALLRFVS